jgi:hypothetical protein
LQQRSRIDNQEVKIALYKPAYACLSTEDKSINPAIQHKMYERSNSKVTEVKSSHVIYISHPEVVAKVIIQAASDVSTKN